MSVRWFWSAARSAKKSADEEGSGSRGTSCSLEMPARRPRWEDGEASRAAKAEWSSAEAGERVSRVNGGEGRNEVGRTGYAGLHGLGKVSHKLEYGGGTKCLELLIVLSGGARHMGVSGG